MDTFDQQEQEEREIKEESTTEDSNDLYDTTVYKESYLFYGGFWIRFWAYLWDLVIVGSLNRILIYPLLGYTGIGTAEVSIFSVATILTTIVMYIYFVLMTKKFGQTLGKMIVGVKVIDKNNEQLTWSAVVFREVVGKFISKTVLLIGFLIVAFTENKQGWHDMIADTVVIHEEKKFVKIKQAV